MAYAATGGRGGSSGGGGGSATATSVSAGSASGCLGGGKTPGWVIRTDIAKKYSVSDKNQLVRYLIIRFLEKYQKEYRFIDST
jgi:hypothetical protein